MFQIKPLLSEKTLSDKTMKMKFWKQTKIYHTDLSAEKINAIISKELSNKQILFLNPINIGATTIDNFNYTAFRPGRIIPVKVKATFWVLKSSKTGFSI